VTVIDALVEPLSFGFFVRGLAASMIVGLVCAVVGTYLVLRGLTFMGDAISHAAFPGVVAAYLLGGPFYLGAAAAAVMTALGIGWVGMRGGLRGDAATGVLFAGMFALGIFMFSLIPNYVGDLFGFLVGDVLGIGNGDVVALAVLATVVLATVVLLWKELLFATFDPLGAATAGLPIARYDYLFLTLVAFSVVASLQAVGIILAVAMLVTPPATAQMLTASFGRLMTIAVAIGIAGPIAGMFVSYWLNAATGATIVLLETGLFLLVVVARRSAIGPRT
jgi:manganese/iron transport system permease protein